ncbi:cell division protein FtsL [Inmirania thermothiophila]|uniref:Cell division protein FtsL n=1 Tax=Inmirania thermothiophila TaxID=1750597 RepID=A0A3N1XXM8_9GAMM|nr:cell division protein FtsL [Inmirania thermothiophila]
MPVVILAAAVAASALAVVWSRHESRRLFAELQGLEQRRDALQVEWGRLQIEQATWAADGRIETIASGRLGMRLPAPDEIVIVRP